MKCISAGGKSNVFHHLNLNKEETVLIIADGSAFGSEIDKVLHLLKERGNASLYLPESFEWLILSANIFNDKIIKNILDKPANYIECKEFFSWERFFTALLNKTSKNTYLAYSKKTLNKAYLNKTIKSSILAQMNKIVLNWKTKQI